MCSWVAFIAVRLSWCLNGLSSFSLGSRRNTGFPCHMAKPFLLLTHALLNRNHFLFEASLWSRCFLPSLRLNVSWACAVQVFLYIDSTWASSRRPLSLPTRLFFLYCIFCHLVAPLSAMDDWIYLWVSAFLPWLYAWAMLFVFLM